MGQCECYASKLGNDGMELDIMQTESREKPIAQPERPLPTLVGSSYAAQAKGATESTFRFSYFPLWAKGPSCALALAHSGLEWEGNSVDLSDWGDMKQNTPWRHLPVLQTPDGQMIGHEIAILNFIGSSHFSEAMGGKSSKDCATSQQLLQEAEDLYQKMQKVQPTVFAKDKVPKAELDKMWIEADTSTHNAGFGYATVFQLLEEFYAKCDAGEGKFTETGLTVGECSLFAKLHALVMLKADCLDKFKGVAAFYKRFKDEPATQEIIASGGKMGKPFGTYFVNP